MINTLKNKSFKPLWLAHFFGTFNDNLIKNVFVFLAAYKITSGSLFWLAGAFLCYGAIFLATTAYAGVWADKYSRTTLLAKVKLFEIGVMLLTTIGLYFNSRFVVLLTLCCLGFSIACSRVAKYSLIPNLVSEKGLLSANALIKGLTFLASIISVLVLLLLAALPKALLWIGAILVAGSVLSYLCVKKIPAVAPADSSLATSRNPLSFLKDFTREVEKSYELKFYIGTIAWYWLMGGVFGFFAKDFAAEILSVQSSVFLFLTALFSIGFVIGAPLCVYMMTKKGYTGVAPVSGFAMSVLFLALMIFGGFIGQGTHLLKIQEFLIDGIASYLVMFIVLALGISASCFIIPFYPLLQKQVSNDKLGRLFGYTTFVCSLAVIGAVLIVLSLQILNLPVSFIVAIMAVLNLISAVLTCQMLSFKALHKIARAVLKTFFKYKVEGLDNLKSAGNRCLIIPNHTSYLDAVLIAATVDKKITFSLDSEIAKKWWARALGGLIDIRALDAHDALAVKTMATEIKSGKPCMIFTEARMGAGNTQMKIYEGAALMAQKANANVVPVQIKGADCTYFSRLGRRTRKRLFPKITVSFLPPVDFTPQKNKTFRDNRKESTGKLYRILADMALDPAKYNQTLMAAVFQCMHALGRKFKVMEDTARKPLKFKHVILRAFILGRLINKVYPKEETLGVMMPTSAAAGLTVLGLHAFGKTPAMLNFSSGPAQVLSTCHTVKIKNVITARKVVSLAKLEGLIEALTNDGINILYLEDLQKTLTFKDKLFGITAMFFPERMFKKTAPKVKPTDTAVILFTSGSEGMPKAVILSHQNILANINQIPTMLDIGPGDVLMSCLPIFHSFGLTVGLFCPIILGLKTFLYPTPLHYRVIPELCASVGATILFGTDTFMAGYAKCANEYDFNTLRIAAVGAEKLKEETRRLWAEKFGIKVIEGYGSTECSPILAFNTHLYQRFGSVGKLLTGMKYKLKPVAGIKEGQELVVSGPNVMKGYMRPNAPGVLEPPKDGWYETGDIVHIDEDGYIFIKGRCKRFAKIGGEMVSLLSVEQVVQTQWPDFISGVVSVPDPKKGEQLVLITTCAEITQEKLVAAFKEAGVMDLAVPKKIILTDTPPLLGSGKFDYPSAQKMAEKEINGG